MNVTPMKAVIAAVLLSGLTGCEDADQKANTLFVEAAQTITAAQSNTDMVQQYEQLTTAKKTVTEIVTTYPGSSAAVRISANEKIGPYSLAELNTTLASLESRPEFCLLALTRSCLAEMVLGSLETLVKLPPTAQPDKAVVGLALGGFPFANIVARDRVAALLASTPEGHKAYAELNTISFGFPPVTPMLLGMIGAANGEKAILDAITQLNNTPGFKDAAANNLSRTVYTFLNPRRHESAKLLRTAANAIFTPMPEDTARAIAKDICDLKYEEKENAIISSDCTPHELAEGNTTTFHYLHPDMLEQIYAAATDDKKQKIANDIFDSAPRTLQKRLSWYERTSFTTDFSRLSDLYIETMRQGEQLPAALFERLSQSVENRIDSPALTEAGLTPKAILLLHANGVLLDRLPAIYQLLHTHPNHTEQLNNVLRVLAQLQPLTPGMDQIELFTHVGTISAQWPIDHKASKEVARLGSFHFYPKDADPRPAFDALYAGEPYASELTAENALRFKDHGHHDIVEAALAASKPVTDVQSLRYSFARAEVQSLVNAGDLPKALSVLEPLPFITRYYIMGHSLQDTSTLSQTARDAFRTALLSTYAYELSAFEIGWNKDLGVPTQIKVDAFCSDFKRMTDFIGESASAWFIKSFGDLTHDQRMQALHAMHSAQDPNWVLYASAIALTREL